MRHLLATIAIALMACGANGAPALPESSAASVQWLSHGTLTSAGTQLLDELLTADRRGLRPADYRAVELKRASAAIRSATVAEQWAFDKALSEAATRLVLDLHVGRVKPRDVGYDLDVSRPAFDAAAAVLTLARSSNVTAELNALEPQLRHYELLKAALAHYRELAAQNPYPSLPMPSSAPARPGEPYAGASALHSLLVMLGDIAPTESPETDGRLGAALVAGLEHFQSRHGLDPDGVLGKATYRALTTPLSVRVQQIELSLERMRWLPAPLGSPPIIVNIPQFRLFAFRTTHDDADAILQMNVIVGEAFKARRTPVFAADMKYVVLNPYWDVPRSILLKELMADIQRDPRWIETHGYEMVRGDSDQSASLPVTRENVERLRRGELRLRQKPGPTNALGRVKFMFPNRHNVYLHDTPGRALFLRSRRAFSHGCIRVSEPMALLEHVMRDDPTWTEAKKEAALASGVPVRVSLRQPIRVLILYGTALATESGSVLFFEDLYGQDAPLIARLAARARPT